MTLANSHEAGVDILTTSHSFSHEKRKKCMEKTVVSGKGEKTLFSKGHAVCVRVEIKTPYLSVFSTIARCSRMLYGYKIILS